MREQQKDTAIIEKQLALKTKESEVF